MGSTSRSAPERKSRKTRHWWGVLAAIVLLAAIGAVVVRNNSDFFQNQRGPVSPGPVPSSESVSSGSAGTPSAVVPSVQPVSAEAGAVGTAKAGREGVPTLELAAIRCTVLDRKDIVLVVTPVLLFADEGRRRELLIKREDLKVIVRKVVGGKESSAIKTESIESELHAEMNNILDGAPLSGVEIRDFRIEKVERP